VRIELNGQRLEPQGKSQKKVMELLLTIIAFGCQDVASETLCDVLWPDSEGDLAQQTLKTAIFRLRKLIGKTAVIVKDGRVSLNPDCCWIDSAAFEATLKELDDALQYTIDDDFLVTLSRRLFHYYQGKFLNQLDFRVVKFRQTQLQNKLVSSINRLITHYENQGDDQEVAWLREQMTARMSEFDSENKDLLESIR
jgi:DNA-binding SARP family transcriptional activator